MTAKDVANKMLELIAFHLERKQPQEAIALTHAYATLMYEVRNQDGPDSARPPGLEQNLTPLE